MYRDISIYRYIVAALTSTCVYLCSPTCDTKTCSLMYLSDSRSSTLTVSCSPLTGGTGQDTKGARWDLQRVWVH